VCLEAKNSPLGTKVVARAVFTRVGIFGVVGCGAGKRLPQFWRQPAHVMLIWARLEGQNLCVGGIGLVPGRTEEVSGA
jgi:hypothetical protein